MAIFVRFLPNLAKMWLPWQRPLDPCNQKCLLWIGRSLESYYRSKFCQLECGPMPNIMAALPNIGGALCSMPQRLAEAH